MPAAEYVQVQVIDRLAAVIAGVYHHAKASGSMLFADLGCAMQQMTQYFGVGLLEVCQRPYLALGNDQDMHWRYRRNVVECKADIVLEDFLARDLTGENTTEDGCVGHGY